MALQKKTTVRDIYANRTTKKKQEDENITPEAKRPSWLTKSVTKNAGTSAEGSSPTRDIKPNPALAQAVVSLYNPGPARSQSVVQGVGRPYNPGLLNLGAASVSRPESSAPRTVSSDSSGDTPAAKSLRPVRTREGVSVPESKSSAPSISIRSGAASAPSVSAAMKRGQSGETGETIFFSQPTTLERIALSARSGVKDWASDYMDYAAVGTYARSGAGTDRKPQADESSFWGKLANLGRNTEDENLTASALANYQKAAANEQAVIDSYERGEGVYDKADYEVAKEQLAEYQRRIESYRNAAETSAATIAALPERAAEESNKWRSSAAMDEERATHGLGTVGQTLVRGVSSTTQNLLDLGLSGGANARPSIAARVYGQSTRDALDNGVSVEGAVAIGLARAAAELVPEDLFGGNPLTDTQAGDGLVTEAARDVLAKPWARRLRETLEELGKKKYINNFVTRLGAGAFGEGVEEVITQGLNDVISAIAYGDEAELSSPKEYAEAFWGGVVGGLYGNIINPTNLTKNAQQDVDDIARNSAQRAERAAAAQVEQASIDNAAQNAAQGAAGAGGITTGAQAVQSEGGAFNTPQSAQAEQAGHRPRQTTLDIYQNRGTRQENEAVQVGRATTIKKPYAGVTPTQESGERVVVPVSDASLALANSRIEQAENDTSGRSFRSVLSMLYKETFQPQKNIPVNGVTYEGQPYTVDVGRKVPRKVISDSQLSAEKISVLDALPEVIQNAQYVGSGEYGKAGKTNSEAIRYDYFETEVTIAGKEYTVLFDVEVFPSTNNYRTHRLADITITPQKPSDRLVQTGLSSTGSLDTLVSNTNVTQKAPAVNSESQGGDGLGAANAGFDPVSRWQESTDRYHPVNEAAAQTTLEERGRVPTDVPVTDVVGGQVSKHVSTLVNANITTNEMAAALMEDARKGAFSAQPYTDAEAAAKVREHIEQVGWDVAFGEYRADIMSGKASKDISMTGIVLYNNAVNAGALLDAMDVAALMARNSRNVAQAQQVLSVINKLSPESQLYFSIRGLQNLVEQAKARYGKRAENLTVDETLVSEYKDALMRGDEEAAAAVWDQITLDVAQQIPSNFAERLNNWRYLAMLGNPRTHVRNLAGNAGFAPVRITRNLISTGIQAVVLDKANRQRAFINFANKDNAALFRAAADYYGEVVDSIQSGGKYSDAIDEVDAKRGIFRSGALESIRKANSRALDVEDTWFSRPAFAYALASYMKANGITADELNSSTHSERLTHGIEYAVKEAQKATYRDSNAFSDWVASLGKNYHGDNKAAKAANLAVEAALPFKRTPANIVVRGVEYSPVGLVKGLTYDLAQVQKGNMTAADAIDNISSGITGTALLGLGLYLASQALLSGGDDPEDDKQNWFNDLMGYQNYALNVGGKSYTIDWLAPGAMPMFVGAELWKAFSSKNMSLTDALDAISRVTNPMIETSMLSSVNDLLESVANAQTGGDYIKATIESLAASYLSQYIPTLGGQLERTIEDKRYETYRYGDTGALGLAPGTQNQIGKALNKIPGVEFNQIPYIDAWGREEGSGNIGTRIFNNFFNPSYVSDIQRGKVEDELQRLYDANYTNVLPDRPAQSTKIKELGGEYMTANEYVKYARTRGSESLKLISAFLDSDYYKGLSDDQRSQVIGELYALANDEAKRAVVTGRGLSYESDYDKYDSIGDPALYMSMRAAMKQLSESEGKDNEAFKAVYAQWRTLPPKGRAMYTDGVEGQFDGISTLKKLDNCLQAGMSTQQFYEAKAEYRALSDNDSLGATARRAAFAHWLDTESGFTTSARAAALENFPFTTTIVADEGKYEQMASSGVGNAASERIFNSIQQLQPESGNKTVSDLQRYEAITASGASESEQLAALRVYASDLQIEYFQAAFDNGIALGKWTAVLRSVRESKTGNMSQGNLVRAMYENGIPKDKARAMYNVYKAKHNWRSSYEQAYANAW